MKTRSNRESRSYTCPKSPTNIARKNVGTVKIKEIIIFKKEDSYILSEKGKLFANEVANNFVK